MTDRPCTYTVHREAELVVVTCAVCGPVRLTVEAACALIDPVLGLPGPLGRFQAPKATRAERRRLVGLLCDALETPRCCRCDTTGPGISFDPRARGWFCRDGRECSLRLGRQRRNAASRR